MSNSNCLAGMRCLKCGYEDRFAITMPASFTVTDDGTEFDGGDLIWDSSNDCSCGGCGFCGVVRDFEIDPGPI
jgi:hypothetical protein